jgi:FkbM family methyltransferase
MINKNTFIHYAQYNEDIILAALFSEQKNGFYVDVGANHESYHSVTKYFYDQGWKGINIEPIPRLLAEFSKKRKRDINLQLAVAQHEGQLELRDYPDYDGLSTLSDDNKNDPDKVTLPHKDYIVQVDALKNIFEKNQVVHIDFLKIDVEGYEFEVLRSNDWKLFRPTVVCIEANHRSKDWSKYLETNQYSRIIFDGLNEYYLADESLKCFDHFAERATVLAHNALREHHATQWQLDINRIKFLEDLTDRQDTLIKSTQHSLETTIVELRHTQEQSLQQKPWRNRLKLALKGLTIDYYRYIKS